MIKHPIDTAQGLYYAATHPKQTKDAILVDLKETYHEYKASNNLRKDEMISEFVGSFAGPGVLAKVAKVSAVAATRRFTPHLDSKNVKAVKSQDFQPALAENEIPTVRKKGIAEGVVENKEDIGRSQTTVIEKSQQEVLPTFASDFLLDKHFKEHGSEFHGVYNTAPEYLQGAHDVIKEGIKVAYEYNKEIRIGYVRFMGNTAREGVAKFEFVGTNHKGNITTYHVESGKKFWKTLNDNPRNKNIIPYDHPDQYILMTIVLNLKETIECIMPNY